MFSNIIYKIKDAQIAQLGLELYQDIYGQDTIPPITFLIPKDDDRWPIHLWGYPLGIGVQKHIAKHLGTTTATTTSNSKKNKIRR